MNRKILLTGATGFLGSHLAKHLARGPFQTFLCATKENRSQGVRAMDLTDSAAVQETVMNVQPDVLIHLGGLVNLTRDWQVAKECIQANIVGTLNLMEALRGIKLRLCIYVSTEEVYGNSPIPYRESTVPQPPSPYAMTKLAGEHLCGMYAGYLGFRVIILRVATMYGPGDAEKRFIPSIITRALRGEDIPLNSGKKTRDYVYVDDVADAVVSSLMATSPSRSEVINIGGGTPYALSSVVEKIVEISRSHSKIQFGVLPERVFEADKWFMDISKARNLLGWVPRTSLVDGLRQTMEYYKRTL